MLTELWVHNLALLERLHITFGAGLNVLTGETGAGKSLVVGALDLALGARSPGDVVRSGADAAEIIARFELPPGAIPDDDAGDDPGVVLLRRVIAADGRSRAYVNDRPATVGRLRGLGERLADLHGQHEQQNILREDSHLDYLDAFAGNTGERGAFTAAWEAHREAREALEAFREATRRGAEEHEFLSYQLQELTEAELREDEEAGLARDRRKVAHAAKLGETVTGCVDALSGEDAGVAERLARASRLLDEAVRLDDGLEPLRRQIDETLVAVEEIARDLEHYLDGVEADPERLETVEARLDRIATLKRKYRASVEELIERRDDLRRRLVDAEDPGRALEALERRTTETGEALAEAAGTLSAARSRAAARLAREVSREIAGLGMTGARFEVALAPPQHGVDLSGRDGRVGSRGAETASFRLAANPGEPAGPLVRVASGGEASRVMLALKTVLRRVDPVPLVIFDEIDTGIGGLVAEAVGKRLRSIAGERQVLVVTHLAVVASRADHHVRLTKTRAGKRTRIAAEGITGAEREDELARMLAGSAGGDEARRTARTLLGERSEPAR